jgi:nucleotide-binding universal stress UspA family protein
MSTRILLGIDTNISPATHRAIDTVCEIMQQPLSQLQLVLLHVISPPAIASPSLGMYVSHALPSPVSAEQQSRAAQLLDNARAQLQLEGSASVQIEVAIRVGVPAEEIATAARELRASFIVIGCRGNTWRQHLRRLLIGSTSRRVLRLARCPVMIVPAPKIAHPGDLVRWYEEAITHYLREHPHALSVFTPREAALMFVPYGKKIPGRKEIAAAALALEQLAGAGRLCRHDVRGELKYVND